MTLWYGCQVSVGRFSLLGVVAGVIGAAAGCPLQVPTCKSATDCPAPLVCGVDGHCRAGSADGGSGTSSGGSTGTGSTSSRTSGSGSTSGLSTAPGSTSSGSAGTGASTGSSTSGGSSAGFAGWACGLAGLDAGFSAPVHYGVGAGPVSEAVGDFNGDGKPDLAIANNWDSTLTVLLGHGDGGFAVQATYDVGFWPVSLAVGDFNGDGKLDLVVANSGGVDGGGSGTLSVLVNSPSGSRIFAAPATYFVGQRPESVTTGDLNGDGRLDLAVVNQDDNTVGVLLNLGDGGRFAGQTTYAVADDAGAYPMAVVVADFDGDGRPDLAVLTDGDSVGVLLGQADGGFGVQALYGTGSGPTSVVAADLNGDGLPDLAVADYGDGTVSVLLNQGPENEMLFASPVDYEAGGLAPGSMAVGDFDGDGKPDLAVASEDPLPDGGYGLAKAGVFLNQGGGSFAPQLIISLGDAGEQSPVVVVGDFTGDGRPDLAVTTQDVNAVTVLLNEGAGWGHGGFLPQATYAIGSLSNGDKPVSIAAGDFNGDGLLDLAVANPGSDSVAVLLGQPGGSFAAQITYSTESGPQAVAVGDFSGDGKPDIAVANGGDGTIDVLTNDGAGNFPSLAIYDTPGADAGSGPIALAVGDFDADGRLDLAVVDSNTQNVAVFLSLPDGGGFGQPVAYGVATYPYSVAVGDFNRDGKPDLAVACNNNSVYVLLNQGAGTFAVQTDPPAVGSASRSVAVGDFNGDGKPDLAVANYSDGTVSVLLGTGTGSFGAQTTFQAGSGAFSVAVGDFNGDGKPDLAVSDENFVAVSVLVGTGAGSFGSETTFAAGVDPISVAVGDFNGDGWPDLAVANQNDATVSVLLDSCLP